MDDERMEKETNEKTETSKGLGFIVFGIFGILQQVVESINPYSWVPSEKESVEPIEVDIKEVQEKKIPQRKRKADDVCEDEPAPQKKRTEAGGLSAIVPSSAIEWIQSKVSSCISQASQYASRWWESIKPFIPLANQGTKRQRSEAEKFEENVSKRRKIETKKHEKKQSIPYARKRIMGEIQRIQQRNTAKEPGSSRRAITVETNLSINRFKIYGELGSGSFGQVLLAKDQLKEKYVALKRIRKNRFIQSIADVRIEQTVLVVAQECRFLTRLNAIFETTDSIFLVLDYISGGTLGELVKKGKVLENDTIQFLAAEIICGLNFLHSRGFIHRDLKPHNILLHNTGHAEIADFGLSADTRRSGGMAEGFCGTRAYIAPEVSLKCKYNKAVDYYSLGIILFQMATGMDPQYARYRNRFRFLKNVSPELQDLILKLLCENPNQRMRFVASIRDHPFFANIVWSAIEAGRIPTPINLRRHCNIQSEKKKFRYKCNK